MRTNILEFIVDSELPLSEFLKTKLTKKFYRRLKYINAIVLVDGQEQRWYLPVKVNSVVKIIYDDAELSDWAPDYTPIKIYYEDSHYIVCYKEANLLTIPTKGEPFSLYQRLLAHLSSDAHISFLNRLDRETQGLLLVAKDTYSSNLLQPIKQKIKRKYLALVEGQIVGSGTISKKIARSEDSNRRIISPNGKDAITHYRSIWYNEEKSLLELELETGRTHQIRVHLASLGHPIIGDSLYGSGKEIMCLESHYLSFVNPYTNKLIECESEGPIWKMK